MTLFEFMPALWTIFVFIFFVIYFLFDMRLFLVGCGGALLALCPSLLGAAIFIQTAVFFIYVCLVYGVCLIKRLRVKKADPGRAIALTKIDRRGGYILYKGRVRRAYPRDRLYEYVPGDVLAVTELSNGALFAYRI